MSGQRLMCVWQAIYVQNPASKGKALKADVRKVTARFAKNTMVKFSGQVFDDWFTGEVINFDNYVEYMRTHLVQNAGLFLHIEEIIEEMCWDMCKDFYKLGNCGVQESDGHKLWQVYSRLCVPDTVPPNMEAEEANWIGEKLAAHLGQHWTSANVPHTMCYGELMSMLAEKCFTKVSKEAVSKVIDDLFLWLVQEVAMTGWLHKRSRKQNNWTWWLKRWFVLTPGLLTYYETNKMDKKKGEVVINSYSQLEELPDLKVFGRHYPFRFKVVNSPYLELELSPEDDHQRHAWMASLRELVDAAKAGTTPVQAILKERMVSRKSGKHISIEQATSKMSSLRLRKNLGSTEPSVSPKSAGEIPQILPMKGGQDENIRTQVNKIQDIFSRVDKDRNGAIDQKEFQSFIQEMGLQVTNEEINCIFNNIEVNHDGIITIDEFTNYFLNTVLDESTVTSSKVEARLQSAFLAADRNGTGSVDFREFAEYLWDKRRSLRISKVISAFDKITAGEGEISANQFKQFFASDTSCLASIVEEEEDTDPQSIEGRFRNMYNQADANRIASFLRERWDVFASFKRRGQTGEIVMVGGHGMVADVMPGNYNLVDLACFSDLPPIVPKHIVVKDIFWLHAPPDAGHGKMIFPKDFNGELPIEIATSEHLRYYGSSFADSTQQEVSLMYRHGIQDFTYQNKYLDDYVKTMNGGAGMEKHDFSHLDCPLEDDSGYFVMAKREGDDIHLTAFKVPTRHTIYIPGGVIHSNDYLKGTWRTMLSDETEIDHVHIVRRKSRGNNDNTEHFTFTFV